MAKPENWGALSQEEKETHAKAAYAHRGRYLIAQALRVASETLQKKEFPEESNAEDMEMILEVFFTK